VSAAVVRCWACESLFDPDGGFAPLIGQWCGKDCYHRQPCPPPGARDVFHEPQRIRAEIDDITRRLQEAHAGINGPDEWTIPARAIGAYIQPSEENNPTVGIIRIADGDVVTLGGDRASVLADECGRLHDENRELLAENATLRRKLERAERKGGAR